MDIKAFHSHYTSDKHKAVIKCQQQNPVNEPLQYTVVYRFVLIASLHFCSNQNFHIPLYRFRAQKTSGLCAAGGKVFQRGLDPMELSIQCFSMLRDASGICERACVVGAVKIEGAKGCADRNFFFTTVTIKLHSYMQYLRGYCETKLLLFLARSHCSPSASPTSL